MKVFLDVGAHQGETLQVAQQPRWAFDRIVCFEPAPNCWAALDAVAQNRTEVFRFGLWSRTETLELHNPGDIGASVFEDKDPVTDVATCEFRDAAQWFSENLSADDEVFMKVNVEGAEAELITRLCDTGEISKVDHLMIHFDVRKVPSQRRQEAVTRALLESSGVEYFSAEDIQFGIVGRGTANWLKWCHGHPVTRDLRYLTFARIWFAGRRILYPLKRWVMSRGGGAR